MVHGPWKGDLAGLLLDAIRRADLRTEISQTDVQYLLWAILSRAKPSKLRGRVRETALKLLTKEELAKLEGFGLDVIENRIMGQLLGRFDQAMRPILEAENKLRGMFYQANRPFEEIQRIAVLPPLEGVKSEIPKLRWLWRPEGYAIRYDPKGFMRLEVYVVVPHRFTITRDSKGRIIRLEGPPGYISEVEYDDSVPSIKCPTDENLTAYKFKKITLIASGHTATFENVGWTFVGIPKKKANTPLWSQPLLEWKALTRPPLQFEWFQRWRERAERAQEARERMEEARHQAERMDRILRGDASDEDFLDISHYRDGVEAATGDPSERAQWIAEHHARQSEAPLHAINVLEGLPDGTEVDTSDRVGLPGHSGAQRLGAGTRTW